MDFELRPRKHFWAAAVVIVTAAAALVIAFLAYSGDLSKENENAIVFHDKSAWDAQRELSKPDPGSPFRDWDAPCSVRTLGMFGACAVARFEPVR